MSHDGNPTLDYGTPPATRGPATAWRRQAVLAFVLATMLGSFLLFGHMDWVRLARPGSRLYGPQDQYIDLAHAISAWISGIGMCVVGGGTFTATLLARGALGEATGVWAWATVLGLLYVSFFGAVVRIAEHVAGANIGGPTPGEYAAHVVAGVAYPLVAGWVMSRIVDRRG